MTLENLQDRLASNLKDKDRQIYYTTYSKNAEIIISVDITNGEKKKYFNGYKSTSPETRANY